MALIKISDSEYNQDNLLYVQTGMSELFKRTNSTVEMSDINGRSVLTVSCPDTYTDIIKAEVADRVSETIAINYKYDFFNKSIKVSGLSEAEREILLVSLISADLDDDKRYIFDRFKTLSEMSIDGMFNFRLMPLKKKWVDVVGYIPTIFINSQLKEFVTYLLENKRKRVFINCGKVYDSHYRRLLRVNLIRCENLSIIKEVLLSGCGEVELSGTLPKEDEYYLKEFFGDKIYFSNGYCP